LIAPFIVLGAIAGVLIAPAFAYELYERALIWWLVRREMRKPGLAERIRRQIDWQMKRKSTRDENDH